MTHGFGNRVEGGGLALMLAIAAIGVGIIGWGSPQVKCTPSTIGTATCNLPVNGCDGVYRVGIGRCERSASLIVGGATTVTIAAGSSVGTASVTFPTAFTNQPNYVYFTTQGMSWTGFPTTNTYSQVPFLVTNHFPWAIPVALTEFPGNQTDETVFNPSGFIAVQLSVTFSQATIPAAGSTMLLQISGDSAVSWTTLVSFLVDGTGAGCAAGLGGTTAFILCSDFVTLPALPSLTADSYLLRVAGSGGDGTTKIQWSQIQASFKAAVIPPPPIGPIELAASPSTTSFTARIETPSVLGTGTSISAKFFWQAWSYNG